MKLHGNARTCPHSRRLVVERVSEQGWTLAAAAEAAGVSVRTVSKWLRRYPRRGRGGSARSLLGAGVGAASHAARSGSRRSRRCGGCG